MSRTSIPDANNAFAPNDKERLNPEVQNLIARRERLLGPAYRLFYREPVQLVRGEGVWLFDAQGKRYLDAYNNVASVGHCHPSVTAALTQQASTLNTHTRYLHEGILNYTERLLATFPAAFKHVMLTCTGSESNDLAIRISKAYTGGTGFIVTQCAYHGNTDAVAQLSPSLVEPGAPLCSHVVTIAPPDSFRERGDDVGKAFGRNVQEAIESLKSRGIKIAALLCDTVFSSDGIFVSPLGFLAQAVEVVHEAGGLFIADEVQAGFGRTGESMWGFGRHRVIPDLVTLGKPMGNGHPVAGVVMRPDVIAEFGRKTRFFNTFGGNPVSCAAALATLHVLQQERLMENADAVGSHLMGGLRELAKLYCAIGDIRGAGLSIGVEIVIPETHKPDATAAIHIVNGLRDRGVLISATGPRGNVLKIRPPLVFARCHADLLVDTLRDILSTLPCRN